MHLHGAERAVVRSVGRIVGQRVLVANIVRDLRANRFGVISGFREEGQAAGGIGQFGQSAVRAFFMAR